MTAGFRNAVLRGVRLAAVATVIVAAATMALQGVALAEVWASQSPMGTVHVAPSTIAVDLFGTGTLNARTAVITLNGVIADGNNFGANLQGANVSVSNSSFSGNTSGWSDPIGYGLNVNSTGPVTLAGVTANDNQVYGANILAGSSVLISDSHFNGNQSYYWWGDKTYYGYGLQVVTNADIALLTVTANGNYLLGAHVEGADLQVAADQRGGQRRHAIEGDVRHGRHAGLVLKRDDQQVIVFVADEGQRHRRAPLYTKRLQPETPP